ncbi:hypothetical protein AMTRI_Chr11g97690 [Amborella trichopoda]
MGRLVDDLKPYTETVKAKLMTLKEDMTLIKRALSNTSRSLDSRAVREPEPRMFERQRDSKVLKNFLWDMEQYFYGIRAHEKDRVGIYTMYVTRDGELWWRMRVAHSSRSKLSTWEALKQELKEQFLSSNTA